MIRFITKHKIGVAVACAAIVLCAALTVALMSRSVAGKQEDVPTGRVHDAGIFDDAGEIVVHDSAKGEIVIATEENGEAEDIPDSTVPLSAQSSKVTDDPEAIWTEETYAGNHTPVEKAQMKDGSLGVLTIPAISLSANVYESPDNMEAMDKGIAHFPSSSAWDGNVSMSAHNINLDGSDGYFKNLHTLVKGDTITYQTALGERTYAVESVSSIAATDWTPLGYTDDHRITLITCISGQPEKRLCVTALEAVL
jgi:LPXTG-site transpeptidase (sortase) family protein